MDLKTYFRGSGRPHKGRDSGGTVEGQWRDSGSDSGRDTGSDGSDGSDSGSDIWRDKGPTGATVEGQWRDSGRDSGATKENPSQKTCLEAQFLPESLNVQQNHSKSLWKLALPL